MHREVLTEGQIEILELLKVFKEEFYLAGGTAVALHIGHRRSIDFDLFSRHDLETVKIISRIKRSGFDIEATMEDTIDELTLVIQGVKVTFMSYPFDVDFPDSFDDIIMVPDLLTLSSMKAYSLGRRSKWKDYVDLFFILRDYYSISNISDRAREVFRGAFNERLFREQLSYFEDIDFSEEVEFVNESVGPEKIKDFLISKSTGI